MNPKEKLPLLVIWDGDCGFCQKSLQWIQRQNPEGNITYLSFHSEEAAPWRDKIGIENLQRSMYVIEDDQFFAGSDGFRILLSHIPEYRWLSTLMGWPLIKQLCRGGYRIIAANRNLLGKHSCKFN